MIRPAVLLVDPKYPRNLAGVIRSCAAYGIETLRYTGTRLDAAITREGRLPREERMKGYASVEVRRSDRPFDEFPDLIPIAVEVRRDAEMLHEFEHPQNALYVFGPEDGGLTGVTARHCHRFIAIPTRHCLNLGVAVATTLYDRQVKLDPGFRMDMALTEGRRVHG